MPLFSYTCYQTYLAELFGKEGALQGKRSLLAKELGCQPSFLTQVFKKRVHLSLEHAHKTTTHLRLSGPEKDFFILLVLKAKAGSTDLELFFEQKIQAMLEERSVIKNRISIEDPELDFKDKVTYYSSVTYSLVHILTSIPQFQTEANIAKKLKLNTSDIREVLNFLVKVGLIEKKTNKFQITQKRIHLSNDYPQLLQSLHRNFRLYGIDKNSGTEKDLKFSAVYGISKKDHLIIKNKILELLEGVEKVVKDSSEEDLSILSIDFFCPG